VTGEMNKTATYFDWIQLTLMAVVSPLFIFPKQWSWWLFLVIPLLWGARKWIKGRIVERTLLEIPLFVFLAALFVTTVKAGNYSHGLPKIAGVVFAVVFYYAVVALLKTEKLLKWAVMLFLAGGVGFSIIGLLGMPTFKEKHLHLLMKIKDRLPRLNFGLPGAELGFAPTVVGGMLLLVIPLMLVMAVYYWQSRKGAAGRTTYLLNIILLMVGLLLTGFVLLLTQARGAWAGLFLGTVLVGFIGLLQWIKKRRVYTLVIVGLLVAALLVAVGLYSAGQSSQLRPGLKQAEGTLLFRLQLWDLTLPVIGENLLWGVGLNNFRLIPEVRYFLSHPHNQLLDIAVEMGIFALIAYVSILLLMGYMIFHVVIKARQQWIRFAMLGLGWGQLSHQLFCITDAIPPGSKVGILWWLSLALITALYNHSRSDSGSPGGAASWPSESPPGGPSESRRRQQKQTNR
jgi:putative inorganic carbon (hco3(-)) transporter